MLKCQEELERNPRFAAWFKSRGRQAQEADARPLDGMEIALTINRMVRDKIDPDTDEDDLCYTENTLENFNKLIDALKQNEMPPTVDFMVGYAVDPSIQEAWLQNGNLLGNMTYSREKPKKVSAEEFIESVKRTDQELAPLWMKFPPNKKYFRFPGLALDKDQHKLEQIRGYLKQNGYVEVPATIDAWDDLISQDYCGALARGDHACAAFIKAAFKSLLLGRAVKAREAARNLAGRDIKHIFTIKSNQLTCDLLGEMLGSFKALGARFVSLDEALSDPFYKAQDVTGSGKRIIEETESSLSSSANSNGNH
ncbi:MAG TPA: polysaccharide deacetylase family protein [Blastocatellia bacterium]|nr:polysaccharide deacetylase family protein [Blastocatellia bacterium]